jgi:hypothetical protein
MIYHSIALLNTLRTPSYRKTCFFGWVYGRIWKENTNRQLLLKTRMEIVHYINLV